MSLVYSEPKAAALFWTAYAALAALDGGLVARSLAGGRLQAATSVRGPAHRPTGLIVLLAAEVAGLVVAAFDATVLPWRWPLLVAGVTVAWVGFALRLWAKRTLGRFFVGAVVIQREHEVVTSGPYAVIRHPGYAGAIVAMTGIGMATGSLVAMALFTLTSIAVFVRTISVEEAVLTSHLDSYTDYRGRTARLVPGVW